MRKHAKNQVHYPPTPQERGGHSAQVIRRLYAWGAAVDLYRCGFGEDSDRRLLSCQPITELHLKNRRNNFLISDALRCPGGCRPKCTSHLPRMKVKILRVILSTEGKELYLALHTRHSACTDKPAFDISPTIFVVPRLGWRPCSILRKLLRVCFGEGVVIWRVFEVQYHSPHVYSK